MATAWWSVKVEAGQLRVWDGAFANDETPFLVLKRVVYPAARVSYTAAGDDWQILWQGKLSIWSTHRIKTFSEVISDD